MMSKKIYYFFPLILCWCIVVYLQGLQGDFLFDDFPNLQDLGTYGTIDSWEKARNFIANGFSGPTGRPISLATFLFNDNTWPSIAYSFKYTNLMIHLLNGVLLCWAIYLLLKNYKYKEEQSLWIALLASAIWLLHPYFVSTTLYVVQRMAQLATVFSLIGMIGYLKARLLLKIKLQVSYVWMTLSILICTVLATYSKENGALLPLLILVIEFCNPDKTNKPIWQWRAVFLWLPSLAIAALLAKYIELSGNVWPNRNFNQVERLYSEARIVTEYLYNLVIPRIELRGLYQDGYQISKSVIQPITTLYSILFLLILLISAFLLRKNYPLYALAILFFFSAHLMESTVVGLELYFEHRNYLAALLLFLPFASGLYFLKEKINQKLVYLIVVIVLSILSFFTYERAKLWGDSDKLQLYWAKNTPDSPRAQNAIANVLLNQGRVSEANTFLEQSIQHLPESSLLNMRLLLQKVYAGIATQEDFKSSAIRLNHQPFDAQTLQALRTLVEYIVDNNRVLQYGESTLFLIQSLEQNSQYKSFSVFQRLTPYLKAKIYLAENKPQLALNEYLIAVSRYNDVEAGMMMVAELGGKNYPDEALILLDKVKQIYLKQPESTLRRPKKEYNLEISRITLLLQQQKIQGMQHVKN